MAQIEILPLGFDNCFNIHRDHSAKKRQHSTECCPFLKNLMLSAAISGCTAAGTAFVKYEAAGKLETVFNKIDPDRFCPFHKVFVGNECESVYGVYVIGVFWLIQGHCQRGPPSAHFI